MNEIDGRKLREYISDNNIKIALSEKQSDLIIEQMHQDGFNLYVKDGNLYLSSVDQEGFHDSVITTDILIDLAARSNYTKLMDAKSRLDEGLTSITEFCKNLKDVCKLTQKGNILDGAYAQTDKAINLQHCLNETHSEAKSKIR